MTQKKLLGLDTPGSPPIRARYILGEVEYRIALRWNEREEIWTARVETMDGEVLIVGIRCATGQDLLRNIPAGEPIGALIVEDPGGTHREPDALGVWSEGLRVVWDDGDDGDG